MTSEDPNLARLRRLVPHADLVRVEIRQRLERTFIDVPAAAALEVRMRRQMRQLQPLADGSRGEVDIILLSGMSGAGKTSTVARVMREFPALVDTSAPMVLSHRIRAPLTLKGLAGRVLEDLGASFPKGANGGERWDEVKRACEARGIAFLVFDEVHDLANTDSEGDRTEILAAFKGIAQHPQWPMALILCGTEAAIDLIERDLQVVRRGLHVPIPKLDPEEDSTWLRAAIEDLCHVAGIGCEIRVGDDTPARAMHAASYACGETLALVVDAIDEAVGEALDNGRAAATASLDVRHFAAAWTMARSSTRADNPFLASDWRAIDASKLRARPR